MERYAAGIELILIKHGCSSFFPWLLAVCGALTVNLVQWAYADNSINESTRLFAQKIALTIEQRVTQWF